MASTQARVGDAGAEAHRPDPKAGGGAQDDGVPVVGRVLGELVEGRPVDRHWLEGDAVELDRQLPLALDGRVGAAGLVGDDELLAVLPGAPGPLPRAAREDLGARRHHPGAGRVARPQRLERRRQVLKGVLLAQLRLDRLLGGEIVALAEVEPAQRPAEAPEEEAGPALAAVRVPERPLGVDRDREPDPEPLQSSADHLGVGAEGEARRLDADRPQARVAIAAVPLGHVGEGPHAVELGEVDEVDQRGPAGGEHRHRLRFLADPGDFLG